MTNDQRVRAEKPRVIADLERREFHRYTRALEILAIVLAIVFTASNWVIDLPVADLRLARILLTVNGGLSVIGAIVFFTILPRRYPRQIVFRIAAIGFMVFASFGVAVSGNTDSPQFYVIYALILATTWIFRSPLAPLLTTLGSFVLLLGLAFIHPAFQSPHNPPIHFHAVILYETFVMTFLSFLIARENARTRTELVETSLSLWDVTKHLEAQKAGIEYERNIDDALLSSIGDGVFAIGRHGTIFLFNDTAVKLTGIPRHEVIGKHYTNVLTFTNETTGEPVTRFIEEAMSSGRPVLMPEKTTLATRYGRQIPVADSASPITTKENQTIGVIVVFRDVTQRREIDRMKSDFISIASHQLRTPLSAVKWFLELLMRSRSSLEPKPRQFLDQAHKSNERMIRLVNDMLNVSRIESGTLAIRPTPTDLAGLIRSVLVEVESMWKVKSLTLTFTEPTPPLPQISIDPQIIRQAIQNFVTNAIKYTPERGSITVSLAQSGDRAYVEVTDTGFGIPKHQQSRIFHRFFRADNVILRDTEGTGLGLYVAKSSIEQSGGSMGFSSIEGKGSTFWFTLPLAGSRPRTGDKTLEESPVRSGL